MNVLPKYWGVISSLTSTVNGAWVYGFKNRINRHTNEQGSPTAGRPLPLYTTAVRGHVELALRANTVGITCLQLYLYRIEQPDRSIILESS